MVTLLDTRITILNSQTFCSWSDYILFSLRSQATAEFYSSIQFFELKYKFYSPCLCLNPLKINLIAFYEYIYAEETLLAVGQSSSSLLMEKKTQKFNCLFALWNSGYYFAQVVGK